MKNIRNIFYSFKNEKINLFINIPVLLILFFIILNLFKHSFIFADDTDTTLHESFIKIFFNSAYANGLIIPSILEKLLGTYIPPILNIHPSDFKSEYFSFIESFLILIFSFIPIKIMFLNKSDNIIYKLPITVYLFIISFYMYALQKSNLMIFTYDGFFRLNMPIFIFLLLFFYLIKTLNKITYKDYFIICLLTILCCLSCELTCILVILGTLIYTFLSLFDKNKISNKRFYLLVIILIFSISSSLFLFKFGAFIRKTPNLIIDLNFFTNIFKILPEFIKEYIKYLLMKHIIAYVLLISQIAVLFFKTNEKNSIKIVISYLLGLLIFFFSLIGLGYYPNTNNSFYIIHPDIQTTYEMIILAFNLYLFSVILKNKILKNYIVNLVFIVVLLSSILLINKNISFYNNFIKNILIPLKITHYKSEKIIRLANLKNKTIYLDYEIFNNPLNWGLFYNSKENEKNVIYPDNTYIIFLNNIGMNITQKVIYTDKEIVDKEYKAMGGGIFTEEELNNIKFNRLTDNNFLLNTKP